MKIVLLWQKKNTLMMKKIFKIQYQVIPFLLLPISMTILAAVIITNRKEFTSTNSVVAKAKPDNSPTVILKIFLFCNSSLQF